MSPLYLDDRNNEGLLFYHRSHSAESSFLKRAPITNKGLGESGQRDEAPSLMVHESREDKGYYLIGA